MVDTRARRKIRGGSIRLRQRVRQLGGDHSRQQRVPHEAPEKIQEICREGINAIKLFCHNLCTTTLETNYLLQLIFCWLRHLKMSFYYPTSHE